MVLGDPMNNMFDSPPGFVTHTLRITALGAHGVELSTWELKKKLILYSLSLRNCCSLEHSLTFARSVAILCTALLSFS